MGKDRNIIIMKKIRKSKYKEGNPLHFNDVFRYALEVHLRVLVEQAKYLRWYKDDTYLRFRINDEPYKIIISEAAYQTIDEGREFYDGSWKPHYLLSVYYNGSWHVNAIRFCETTNDIVKTCIDINNSLIRLSTEENVDKMMAFAESQKIDPTSLEYDYIMKENGRFLISHDENYEELMDELTRKFLAHIGYKQDKMGAALQVMKVIACSTYDYIIDERERQLCETLQQ